MENFRRTCSSAPRTIFSVAVIEDNVSYKLMVRDLIGYLGCSDGRAQLGPSAEMSSLDIPWNQQVCVIDYTHTISRCTSTCKP